MCVSLRRQRRVLIGDVNGIFVEILDFFYSAVVVFICHLWLDVVELTLLNYLVHFSLKLVELLANHNNKECNRTWLLFWELDKILDLRYCHISLLIVLNNQRVHFFDALLQDLELCWGRPIGIETCRPLIARIVQIRTNLRVDIFEELILLFHLFHNKRHIHLIRFKLQPAVAIVDYV